MKQMALGLVVVVMITTDCPVIVVPKPTPPLPPCGNTAKYSRDLLIRMIMATFARLDTECTLELLHSHTGA